MNIQQVREIAETAFKTRFSDIEISVNVKPAFDHCGDPMVDVKIIYDAAFEDLSAEGMMRVRSEIFSKVWWEAEDSPGWPFVHFTAKSGLVQHDPAIV